MAVGASGQRKRTRSQKFTIVNLSFSVYYARFRKSGDVALVSKALLLDLYEGDTKRAVRFRYGLLAVDFLTICFLILSSFYYGSVFVEVLDFAFGLFFAAEYVARLSIASRRLAFALKFTNVIDLVVVLSFLAPLLGESFAFLRSFRLLRLMGSDRIREQLSRDWPAFRNNHEVFISGLNLWTFVFVMTELVFITQVGINSNIQNFLDAMYFTITTLTTTGFGDVTLTGNSGRLLAIIIMIFGVSLFLRLVQTLIRPPKVRHACPNCALLMHDRDAVHCKHCGIVLHIPNEGL
jgi:voltage-gated potassium channel